MSESIKDLIERLSAATGPDRELDGKIALAVHAYPKNATHAVARNASKYLTTWFYTEDSVCKYWEAPEYTASIDAALSLVPEGWRVYSIQQEYFKDGRWFVGLDHLTEHYKHGSMMAKNAPTPALAICIAALKARESINE